MARGAQDEARKAVTIVGGKVIEDLKLAIPASVARFADTHPVNDTEVADQLTDIVTRLHGRTAEPAAARPTRTEKGRGSTAMPRCGALSPAGERWTR